MSRCIILLVIASMGCGADTPTISEPDIPALMDALMVPPTAEEVETLVASGQLSMEVVAYEWEIVRHTNWQTDFADVFFVDSQLGWVVGANGKISHTRTPPPPRASLEARFSRDFPTFFHFTGAETNSIAPKIFCAY